MRALGIVLAGGGSSRMEELANRRAVPAMPIAGSYRGIDFALSNMSNSHVQKVAVLTQFNSGSLNQHLNSSKWWDFGRKQGGLYVLNPTVTVDNNSWYRGTADAIYQNIAFLKASHEPYVIITSGDCVYKMNYNDMLEDHINKEADISVAYVELAPGEDDPTRFGVIAMDENGRITKFEEKPEQTSALTINAGVYIVRRRQLIELLENANAEGHFDFVRDILVAHSGDKKIYGYHLEGPWSNIASVDSYFKTNMSFLKKETRDYYFGGYDHVYSKMEDQPPAKYNPGAQVKNALVASGCIVNGIVENSVLFRKVTVNNKCEIRNSIILNDVYIEEGAVIENCIVESYSRIPAGTVYRGENEKIKIVDLKRERFYI